MRRPRLLLQIDASLRQRKRLLVAVLHQGHIRLIAADGREHIEGLDDDRKPFRLAQRRDRFVEPPFLGARDPRERVDHREMPPIADGMKR